MDILKNVLDLFLHLDEYLAKIISDYGTLTYAILFAVIFVETGLVVMPFLPAIPCCSLREPSQLWAH